MLVIKLFTGQLQIFFLNNIISKRKQSQKFPQKYWSSDDTKAPNHHED